MDRRLEACVYFQGGTWTGDYDYMKKKNKISEFTWVLSEKFSTIDFSTDKPIKREGLSLDEANLIIYLTSLVKRLLREDVRFFIAKPDNDKVAITYEHIQGTSVARALKTVLRIDINRIRSLLSMYELNPYLHRLIEQREMSRLDKLLEKAPYLNNSDLVAVVDKLNLYVKYIQDPVAGGLVKKANDFQRSARKKYQNAVSYTKSLLDFYPELYVIRIDLLYEGRFSNAPLGLLQIQDDRAYFIKRLAKELKEKMNDDCLAGYVWTLEHNQENSWYYHFIVFLSIDYEDTYLRDFIGNLWISSASRQANYYIDDSKGLRSIGTGLAKSGDRAAFNRIKKAIFYVTMPDYFLKLRRDEPFSKMKTFGRSSMPKGRKRVLSLTAKYLRKEISPNSLMPSMPLFGEIPSLRFTNSLHINIPDND